MASMKMYTEVSTTWKHQAACRDDDPLIYDEDFTQEVHPASSCRACPVRAQCLTEALRQNHSGTWGGTTDKERASIKRSSHRAHCPGADCRSRNIRRGIPMDLCISCGLSWPAPKSRTVSELLDMVEDASKKTAPKKTAPKKDPAAPRTLAKHAPSVK